MFLVTLVPYKMEMRKFFLLLILVFTLGACTNNVKENENKEETSLNNQENYIEEHAIVIGTNITVEWMPKAYENEAFIEEAKRNKVIDEALFNILKDDIQSSAEEYEGKVRLVFTNIKYTESAQPRLQFAIVNKTGVIIRNIQFDMMIEDKQTKARYIELTEVTLQGDLSVDIPNNTAYYYPVGAPAAIEQPIGTSFGQNDVNVYVENLTYDIVE